MNRREMLNRYAMGFGALGMANIFGRNAIAASDSLLESQRNFCPRAKRVIFLFLNGAPSHIDTFDPKPELVKHEGAKPEGKLFKAANAGFLPSPLKFDHCGQSGLQISESLPQLGKKCQEK